MPVNSFDPTRHHLVRHVSIRHPDSGYVHSFAPGDEVPGWAAAMITNSDIWEDSDGTGRLGGPPPRGGAGANLVAWAEYASHFTDKVTITEDDKRDDIIDKLDAAGVPTTQRA
ncbi:MULTISPECIES: hypothetical protein [Mycobacteriaceae]|uniref:Uncharacterized protein n=1 Tax=Mycolicibacterium neoaurum VKM Ac-1815D TaxID=700508 RepID=V5XJK8_MYCNE|nr:MULTISPECIES: hypothetical protein [Mycobacteriaceae]AHC27819.1 hypothetical protein D174_04205 [Mycolicibacterium neoaurum VKM Ac-1815D]AMO04509.1 hypothetical protein MyAD_04120 [Mycolicibacterium neoaurum]AXK77202.1 hypothetical protein DXK33_21005 [Mycolicibacterium neoaurum]KJQ48532.1 hypothetical protein TS71_20700 [Mycolicibacterium neoaurum]KUM06919.1 hypothetical protein AVZ31_18870 [Mycolicibacterium neoaurum]